MRWREPLLMAGVVIVLLVEPGSSVSHASGAICPDLGSGLVFQAGGPAHVAVADLSGDGIPDLATANGGFNTASVYMGQGDGTFGSPVTYTVGSQATHVAIGDVNGDTKPDL